MDPVQAKLLAELAEELATTPFTKEEHLATLVAAKILTKSGNVTSHYPYLKRFVVSQERKRAISKTK